MPAGTRNQTDAYVHYEFCCVRCQVCGLESNPFVYKDHLNADETITYIREITGFSVRNVENEKRTERVSYVNTGENYNQGGLICPICNENQVVEEEVANG